MGSQVAGAKRRKKQVNVNIGNTLQVMRVGRGLSRADVASHFGCHYKRIWRIEAGVTAIRPPDLQAFAKLYRTTVAKIVGEA